MPRIMSLARISPFFRSLAETGNQTIAAGRTKVSRDGRGGGASTTLPLPHG